MIVIKNFEEILTNYTHFKLEFVFKGERKYNFYYNFKFGGFKGLFAIYCDCKEQNSLLIPQKLPSEPNYFKASEMFYYKAGIGSVNIYLIPFGNILEDYLTLEVNVKPRKYTKVFLTIFPFPDKYNLELSEKLTYPLEQGRESFYKIINFKDCHQKIVVNQLSQLPTLLGLQELLLKESVDKIETFERIRTLEEIKTLESVSKIQNRVHTTISNLSELMKILEEIFKELNEIKEDTQKIGDIASIIEGIDIKADLNIFIKTSRDLKKDLTKYIKNVLESEWPYYKKDKWAKVMINILENWKRFEEKKWKSILKGIVKIAVGDLITEIGSDLISSGMKGLLKWIEEIRKEHKGSS